MAATALAEAVNDALYLRRPLLLEGDPGCGKTRLAYSVAYELGYPLKECYIRSTSRAQDLLYEYDAVRRLYDIQEKEHLPRREYVTLGELGRAIELAAHDRPSVVLIDEIDKADIDFPNDLLLELDRFTFKIKEVKETRKGKEETWEINAMQGKDWKERKDLLPLVIITSNREKELPKAFLRRCLFYYIEFPDRAQLTRIFESHFQKEISALFREALKQFWELRQDQRLNWRKKPSTSELLDWLRLLERDEQYKRLTAAQLTETPCYALPHLNALVKNQSDRDALQKLGDLM
ncbi:MAG: MoxR family ATPase [Gammaproteobacteria bacterium]|nr:MoxR family ATPase [Gammaproteobacteria bacterium]